MQAGGERTPTLPGSRLLAWKSVPALEGEELGGRTKAGSGDGCQTPTRALLVVRWMQVLQRQGAFSKELKQILLCQPSILWMFIQMPHIFSNPHWDKFSQVFQGFLG